MLWALLALALVGLALVIFFVEVLARPPRPSPAQSLFAAQEVWSHRPFTNYQLTIEQEGQLQPRCRQEIKIRDEQVIEVITNTCAGPVLTVADLFATIEKYSTKVVCGPNGCDCDGRFVAHATYDSTLGYPRSLAIEIEPQRRFFSWPPAFIVSCTMIGFDPGPTITVVTLTPLP